MIIVHRVLGAAILVLLAATAATAQTGRRYPQGAPASEVLRGRAVVNDRAAAMRPRAISATTPNASGNFGGPSAGGGSGGP